MVKSVAVYSLKGGVGKSTIAVNLARAAATEPKRRTLLWDLDGQAAASFMLGVPDGAGADAQGVFARDVAPSRLVVPTAIERLDVLPADRSLRGLDQFFFGLGKKKRLEKLLGRAGRDYDRVILDCPPGLTETSEQVLRAADLIIVPVIPSPLSTRAFAEVVDHLDRHQLRRAALLPVFNMVDRRRLLHRAALDANPKWPTIPMASAIEAQSARDAGRARLAPASPAAVALDALWRAIERRLRRPAAAAG